MAWLTSDSPLQGLKGKIGNLVFRPQKDGRTMVSLAPGKKVRKRKLNEQEQKTQTLFKEAIAHAKELYRDREKWDALKRKMGNPRGMWAMVIAAYIKSKRKERERCER